MLGLAIAVIVGISLMAVIWGVYKIFADIPEEDRSYLDRPPPGFRLVWPLIQLLVYHIGPHLSMKYRLKMHNKLRRGGVDFCVSAEQFFASKIISTIVGSCFMLLMLEWLEKSSPGFIALTALASFFYPDLWLREKIQARAKEILRGLPFLLDIITLSVEAGTNLTGALTQAMQKGPEGALRSEVGRVLREIRSGKTRADALRAMAERVDQQAMTNVISNLIQAESMGTSLGPVLRVQSDQRRSERFQRAEKQAMEAPVKLLAPLMMFIFPITFMVLIFLLVSKAVTEGILTDPMLVFLLK